jgi:hypothetical protein
MRSRLSYDAIQHREAKTCRSVRYQAFPDALLRVELRNANSSGILRSVNGVETRDSIRHELRAGIKHSTRAMSNARLVSAMVLPLTLRIVELKIL